MPQIDIDSVRLAFLATDDCRWTNGDWSHEKTVPYSIISQPTTGSYEIAYNGKSTHIAAGEAFFAPANTPLRIVHRMNGRSGEMSARWVHLTFSVFDGLDLFSLYDSPARLTGETANFAGTLIERMLAESPTSTLDRLRHAAARTAAAWPIADLICGISTPRRDAEELLLRTKRLAPLLSYVRQNLAETLTVPEMAGRAFMSPSGFYAYFKQHLGTTPLAYVKRMRLDEAGYRLARTDSSLDDIALAVGFANPFHLSREFKKQFGVSPAVYRKQSRRG